MAYRNRASAWNQPEGGCDSDRGRSARRHGRFITSSSLLEEIKRLYMDNLRLWDCLTLVRGDPSLTCQGAINLVFGLSDEDYLRAFPDTSQLYQFKFPRGTMYYADPQEATSERARLMDENARLHAAIWVLRDNPVLQADSTVAAIFRLDETQFQSKFQNDYSSTNLGKIKVHEDDTYQNNNRAKRWIHRESLDVGSKPNMAIQLSNRPVAVAQSSRRCRSVSDKRKLASSMTNRKRSGSAMSQRDFTSNWKPTSPCECDHVSEGPGMTSLACTESCHGYCSCCCDAYKCDCDCCERERCSCCNCTTEDSTTDEIIRDHQRHSSQPRRPKQRDSVGELKRSNTVSGANDIRLERAKNRRPKAPVVKCVSFSDPSSWNKSDTAVTSGSGCLKDRHHHVLDANHGHGERAHAMEKHPIKSSAATRSADCLSRAHLNSNMAAKTMPRRQFTERGVREPSKRLRRDIQMSPVLQNETPLGQSLSNNASSQLYNNNNSEGKRPKPPYENIKTLNKTSNNDSSSIVKFGSTDVIHISSFTDQRPRPKSAKHRNIHETRMKNLDSLARISKEIKVGLPVTSSLPLVEKKLTTNANNVATPETISSPKSSKTHNSHGRRSSFPAPFECDSFFEEVAPSVTNKEKEEPRTPSFSTPRRSAVSNSSTSKPPVTPEIFLSDQPAPTPKKHRQPYPLKSYASVKHFLDRQKRLTDASFTRTGKEFFTREITPSVEELVFDDYQKWKRNRTKSMSIDYSRKISMGRDHSQSVRYRQLLAEHKEKWPHSLTSMDSLSTRMSSLSSRMSRRQQQDVEAPPPDPPRPPGKLKECKTDWPCYKKDKIKALKAVGNFRFTKPLTTMLKRNLGYQWKPWDKPRPQTMAGRKSAV